MKPSLSDEKYDIIDQLYELGFPSMANNLEHNNPSREEYRYYAADLEKARRETTEEELSQEEYNLAYDLVDRFFSLPNEGAAARIRENKIRQIVRKSLVSERSSGSPRLAAEEETLRRAAVDFAQKYMLMMSHGHTEIDNRQVRGVVRDIIDTVLGR